MTTAKFGGQVARQGFRITSSDNNFHPILCPVVAKTILEVLYFLNLINKNKVGSRGIYSGINVIVQVRIILYLLPFFLFLIYEDYIILRIR